MLLNSEKLKMCMEKALEGRSVHPDSVQHVVASLIQTSLRGVDSHGIHLFPHYCRAVEAQRVNGNPEIDVSRTADAVAVVDADHAFGHHAGAVAIDTSIECAKISGIGAASVRNSTHFGAAAYFGLRAAEKDFLG